MALGGFHINGPALVYTYTGSGGASELLGYTRDGVDVELIKNWMEIFTDIFGPMTPHDFQDMGEVAQISCPLVVTDRTVLGHVMARGDSAGEGKINTPGLVVGATGNAFAVAIASTNDSPYHFSSCIRRPSARVKLATAYQPFTLQLFAWPFALPTVTVGKDTPLYTRSIP